MVAKRWGIWLLCVGWVACWGGEPRTRSAARVAEPAPAGPTLAAVPEVDGVPVLRAVLTDADLAAVAAGGPVPTAEPVAVVEEAALSQGAILALETTAMDATDDLSISFGPTRVEVLSTALDASVIDAPMQGPAVSDLPSFPAAPAPDL